MESARFPSRGGFSVRGIFALVLAVFITVLLSFTLLSSTAYAAGTAEWSGDTILFENHGFNEDNQFSDPTNTIPSGATVYKSPIQPGTGSGSSKVFIIYFSSGVDPPTATSAQYVEFDISSSGTISNPQNAQSITITTQAQSQNSGSSCAISGVGWMVCSLSTFLADGMDTIFDIMANMIKVQPPVLGDTNNSMYVAWNIMRAIANIAFVIVFLIIIYSQLTNFGVNNYGLKRLIPRLIVAAILVNLSFYISALAIDLSNIAGYSIQDIFVGIREDVFHMTDDTVNNSDALTNPSWAALTAVILAGGGIIGGVYFTATGGIYLLLPLLLGLILTIVFVVIVLAARQAIILVLVIVAPLAFVANLLPNTEKWFGKWKDLFMTMLIFFPAFSLVFGGSQLAGQIIIQNAGDDIIMLLFGMAVQIAPLVITPLLLKLSGSLLGKIAQIANNPRKGLLDRNKNWAQARAEHAKQKNIDEGPRLRNPASWGAGMVRRTAYRKQRLQDRTDAHKIGAENNYHKTPGYEKISQMKAERETEKEGIHAHHEEHLNQLKRTSGTRLHDSTNATLAAKKRADISDKKTQRYQNTAMRNERFANRIGANALYQANYGLEAEKANLERSENLLNEHYTVERTTSGTVLEKAAVRLEGSKLRVEGATNRYNEHITKIKTNVKGSELSRAAVMAESTKELSEAANNDLQAFLDIRRKDRTTELGRSNQILEGSKISAEDAKTQLQAFIDKDKSNPTSDLGRRTKNLEGAKLDAAGAQAQLADYLASLKKPGGDLNAQFIESERLKVAQQRSEGKLARIIEEYKAGGEIRNGVVYIDNQAVTDPAELALINEMRDDNARVSAENQGVASAKNAQQEYIASMMNRKTSTNAALTDELMRTAAGIDPNGEIRAEANAYATLKEAESKAQTANETLIRMRASANNKTPKNYIMELLENRLNGDMSESEDLIHAAMDIAAQEAQIPILRRMRRDTTHFNQEHLSDILNKHSGTMKAKGGFDLQNDTSLIGASNEYMNASIAGTLGSTAPDQFTGLKNGEIIERAGEMNKIMRDAELMSNSTNPDPVQQQKEKKMGAGGIEGIMKTYANLTTALRDPDIARTLGDNLIPAIRMHRKIHSNPRYHNPEMEVDYDTLDRQGLRDMVTDKDI